MTTLLQSDLKYLLHSMVHGLAGSSGDSMVPSVTDSLALSSFPFSNPDISYLQTLLSTHAFRPLLLRRDCHISLVIARRAHISPT